MSDARQVGELHLVSGGLDRAAERRTDEQWLRSRLQGDGCEVMWVSHGAVAVTEASQPARLLLSAAREVPEGLDSLTFLGLRPDGRAAFAAHAPEPVSELPGGIPQWRTLRELGLRLPAEQAAMAVTAVALDNWRARTRCCPGCGTALRAKDAGWAMHCPAEGIEHFPRTDPAAIVLVRDRSDRALLGRHVNWDAGWMSTIAGFVEAGESVESAVRREVREETGVRIGSDPGHVRYLGSQPWPFPASLMLGYHAWVDPDDPSAADIAVDTAEIAEAGWFSREELHAACEASLVRLPPRLSISRYLIECWYGASLPGDWLRG